MQNKVLQVLLALKFIDFIKLGLLGMMIEDSTETSSKHIQELTNFVENETLLIINRNLQRISTDQGLDYTWKVLLVFLNCLFQYPNLYMVNYHAGLGFIAPDCTELYCTINNKNNPKKAFADVQNKYWTARLGVHSSRLDWTTCNKNKKMNPKKALANARNKDWAATTYLYRGFTI